MQASDYQKLAMRTKNANITRKCNKCDLVTPDHKTQIAVAALGLVGEAGEVSEHIKKHLGHGKDLDLNLIVKELGDVLWYVARICDQVGVDMSVVMNENIEKLKQRWPEGFDEASPHAAGDLVDAMRKETELALTENNLQ